MSQIECVRIDDNKGYHRNAQDNVYHHQMCNGIDACRCVDTGIIVQLRSSLSTSVLDSKVDVKSKEAP